MPFKTATDADLAALARAGDRTAADALVRRHEGMVRAIAGRMHLPPEVHRDDLVQVGLMALVRAADGWTEAKGKYSTYAFQCSLNAVLDALDRERRHHAPLAREAPGGPALDALPAREDGGDPFDAAPVRAALAALDPTTRRLVELKHGLAGGRPVGIPRAARITGLTRDTAREMYHAGMDKIRAALGAPDPPPPP